MKVYVINLKRSVDRRMYMNQLLSSCSLFDFKFVEGVDGSELSDMEKSNLFNGKKFESRYGRIYKSGELGCTLSHQKCYVDLIASECNYALIFEDDIKFEPKILLIIQKLEALINVGYPLIILLSGGFWYTKKNTQIIDNYSIANVFDAYYTHAYLINKSAAQLLKHTCPYWLADDWRFLASRGVCVKAVTPYLVGQKSEDDFHTLISLGKRGILKKNLNLLRRLETYYVGGMKKILRISGKYEKM